MSSRSAESFPKALRVRRRKDYRYLQRVSARSHGSFVVVLSRRCRGRHGRVGFTVSKKVGRAHVRNLVKRRLRHIMRTHRSLFADRDLVLIAQPAAASADFHQLQRDVLAAIARRPKIRGPRTGR